MGSPWSRSGLRVSLLAGACACAALAGPAAANAAVTVTPDATAKTLRIADDNASDAITLFVTGGHYEFLLNGADIPVNGLTAGADVAITIDGGGGTDFIAVLNSIDAKSLTIDGGPGDDTIDDEGVGTPRPQLLGNDGNDVIEATNQDADEFGGSGDDTLEVIASENGTPFDGAATISGDDGNDTLKLLSDDSSDAITIRPGSTTGHIALRAVLPKPLTEDFDASTVEQIEVDGGLGDDTVSGSDGLAALLPGGLVLHGNGGNDTLTGADTNDTIDGGDGNDTLTGGGGADFLEGDAGDDTLNARDGIADLVRGGTGSDSAVVDAIDPVSEVEHVDVPAPGSGPPPGGGSPPGSGGTPPPAVKVLAATVTTGKLTLVRSRGRLLARVPVSCPPAQTHGCATTLTLQTAKAVRLGGLRGVLVLGGKALSLKGGQRATARVTLIAGAERLAARGRLSAHAAILSQEAGGNFATSSRTLTLLLPPTRPKTR